MKKKTLKANIVFMLGVFVFVIGFLFCFLFKFRYFIFNILMFIGILIETYGLLFMKGRLQKKKNKKMDKKKDGVSLKNINESKDMKKKEDKIGKNEEIEEIL